MKDFSKISDNKDIINKEYIDSYTVPITKGGTGATNTSGALSNLGLSNVVTYNETSQTTELVPVPISGGGTGATTAAQARNNLGITPANIGAASLDGAEFTTSGNTIAILPSQSRIIVYNTNNSSRMWVESRSIGGNDEGKTWSLSVSGFSFGSSEMRTTFQESLGVVTLTQTEYDNLTKDTNTIYMIYE